MGYVERYIEPRDIESIAEIDRASTIQRCSEQNFRETLFKRNFVGVVAEDKRGKILGYAIIKIDNENGSLHIARLVTNIKNRKLGVGRFLINVIEKKLPNHKFKKLTSSVFEGLLDTHNFFKAMGFKATGVEGNNYRFEKEI